MNMKQSSMLGKGTFIDHYLSRNRVSILGLLFCGILSQIGTLLITLSLGKGIHLLGDSFAVKTQLFDSLTGGLITRMPNLILFLVAVILVKAVMDFVFHQMCGLHGERIRKEAREMIFQQQFSFPLEDGSMQDKNVVRYSMDMSILHQYLVKGIFRSTVDVVFAVLGLALLYHLSSLLTIFLFGILFIGFLGVYWINRHVKRSTERRRNYHSNLLDFIHETIKSTSTILYFNKAKSIIHSFNKKSNKIFLAGRNQQQWNAILNTVVPLFISLMMLSILVVSYLWPGEVYLPHLVIYVVTFLLILPVLRRLMRWHTIKQVSRIPLEKLDIIYQITQKNNKALTEFQFQAGRVEFIDVNFTYPSGNIVFSQLNMQIPGGTWVQLKGKKGSGISTWMKLLFGIIHPNSGVIAIDGQDLNTCNPFTYRKYISTVDATLPLYGKTVLDSVLYSKNSHKKEKAIQLVDRLCKGIPPELWLDANMVFGKSGSHLSETQIIILSIARALLTRKPILCIDVNWSDLTPRLRSNFINELHHYPDKSTIILCSNVWPEGLRQPDLIFNLSDLKKNMQVQNN